MKSGVTFLSVTCGGFCDPFFPFRISLLQVGMLSGLRHPISYSGRGVTKHPVPPLHLVGLALSLSSHFLSWSCIPPRPSLSHQLLLYPVPLNPSHLHLCPMLLCCLPLGVFFFPLPCYRLLLVSPSAGHGCHPVHLLSLTLSPTGPQQSLTAMFALWPRSQGAAGSWASLDWPGCQGEPLGQCRGGNVR